MPTAYNQISVRQLTKTRIRPCRRGLRRLQSCAGGNAVGAYGGDVRFRQAHANTLNQLFADSAALTVENKNADWFHAGFPFDFAFAIIS
jgi:hypothetical protein